MRVMFSVCFVEQILSEESLADQHDHIASLFEKKAENRIILGPCAAVLEANFQANKR